MKVAALGDNCIDLYSNLDRYYCTGNAVDFGVHMQRLGIRTSLISVTGNDKYGAQMRKELEAEGLDLSHFHTVEGNTAISYMELIDKERVYGDYVEGVMEHIAFSEEDIRFAKEHDLVHTAFWGNAQEHLEEKIDEDAIAAAEEAKFRLAEMMEGGRLAEIFGSHISGVPTETVLAMTHTRIWGGVML